VRPIVLAFWTTGIVVLLAHARSQLSELRAFQHAVGAVTVIAPDSAPEVSQASIDLAMVLYGIEVPPGAEPPRLDMELKDRGLTTRGAFMEKAKVTVGPAAFTSWSLLGSTLSHEIEVHCQQNFLAIYMMDLAGLDGTGAAERQAYVHELRNARRFGLEIADAQMIADTMDFYYPESPTGAAIAVPKSVRSWLARNFLRGAHG
jgi:hypothetical protein